MPRSLRTLSTVARLTAVAMLLALASGCTIGSPTSAIDSTPPTSEAPAEPSEPATAPTLTQTLKPGSTPTVGECRYVPDGGFARSTDRSRLTPCDEEHTAETVWVGEVTGPEADETVPDYAAIFADTTCDTHLTDHFGSGDWLATRLSPTAFVAPVEDWRLGARWIRCDVYLPQFGEDAYRHGDALSAPVVINDETIKALQICFTHDPDTPELALTVDCTEPHNREPITPTLELGILGEDYPGDDSVESAAEEHCLGASTDYMDGFPDTVLLAWSQPTEEMWEAGHRLIVCSVEVDGGRVAGTLRDVGDQIDVIPFAAGEDDPAIDPYADEGAGA